MSDPTAHRPEVARVPATTLCRLRKFIAAQSQTEQRDELLLDLDYLLDATRWTGEPV